MPENEPPPVLFMKPMPDSDSDVIEAPGPMRTNRVAERDLDSLIEEQRREEEADEASQRAIEQCHAADEAAEEADIERLADQFVEDQGLLPTLSAAEYRAWEERTVARAAREPPLKRPRMYSYLEVEVASGSADQPRTTRVLRVPLPEEGPAMVITTRVVREELRETQLDTAGALGQGGEETEPRAWVNLHWLPTFPMPPRCQQAQGPCQIWQPQG